MQRRIGLLFALFCCLLVLAGMRTAYLGVVQSGKLRQAAATEQLSVVTIPAHRGTIVDRNGVELAVSEPADDIAATPYLVRDPVSAAQRIAPLIGATPDTVAISLARRSTGFVYLARHVSVSVAAAVRRLKIGGLTFISTSMRTYPSSWLASQVLGSVGIDGQGLSGLEYASDGVLHGASGQRRVTSDAIGQPIAIRDTRLDRPGRSIGLTLDATIQTRVEDVLAQVGSTYRPRGASAIVMDPRTNEILAMANWPRGRCQRRAGRAAPGAPEPGGGLRLRTRLDVQGVHGRGSAPGRTGLAQHQLRPRSPDSGGRPHDLRVTSATRRDADDRPDPGPVQQRRRDHDRPEARPGALRQLGQTLWLRPADGG